MSLELSGNSVRSPVLISAFTFSTASMRVCLSSWLRASLILPLASSLTRAETLEGISGFFHVIFSARPLESISSWMAMSSWMPRCPTVIASSMSASVTSSAPPSTIMIESFDAATTMSMSLYGSCWKVGLRIHFSWTRPTRTAAIGPMNGIFEALSAYDAATSAITSASFSWSAEMT